MSSGWGVQTVRSYLGQIWWSQRCCTEKFRIRVPLWSHLLDWRSQEWTTNPCTRVNERGTFFFSLKQGVLERQVAGELKLWKGHWRLRFTNSSLPSLLHCPHLCQTQNGTCGPASPDQASRGDCVMTLPLPWPMRQETHQKELYQEELGHSRVTELVNPKSDPAPNFKNILSKS